MKIIEDILNLDRNFLEIKNQKIIDAEMQIIDQFSKERNSLMEKIKDEFSNNTYTVEQKQEALQSLKISSNLVESKIRDIQKQIKEEKLKLLNSKKAYNQIPPSGSFFIDKTI